MKNSPRPKDASLVHRSGPNALRLLLIGDGNAVGYGVISHELGFGGALAGRIACASARGVDLEIMADDRMTADTCLARLAEVDLAKFDGVILNIGANEVLRFVDPSHWESAVRRVLDQLQEAEVPTYVVALPLTPDDGQAPSTVLRHIRKHVEKLNASLASEVELTADAIFVPLAKLEGPRFGGKSHRQYYGELAAQVAPIVAIGVANSVRQCTGQDESGRQHALEKSDILDSEAEARFDRIVAAARGMFGVSTSAITFIDRDRQWIKAAAGIERTEVPRSGAICATTIQSDGLLIVEDASTDPRFRNYPGVRAEGGVRFYAGYPLETPDGFRVGALCIMDSQLHEFTLQDGAVLRDFALEAQRQLWAS